MKYRHCNFLFLLFSISVIFNNCTTSKQFDYNPQKEKIYAIKNVNIIPMTVENKVIENATVVIKEKKIFSINEAIPSDAKIIDGSNKWLIPGLIDMHVHNPTDANFSSNYPTKGPTFF